MCFVVKLIRNDLAICLLWDVILKSEQWSGGELSLLMEARCSDCVTSSWYIPYKRVII